MTEPAQALINDMKDFIDRHPFEDEGGFPEEYDRRARSLNRIDFIGEIFRQFSDSQLSVWMFRLARYWQNEPYVTWKAVFHRLSGDRNLLYQFVHIASEFLALDVVKMASAEPELESVAHELTSFPYPAKLPTAGSRWFQEMCDEFGIDNWSMWARLASEGAPMNIDIRA